MSFVTLSRELCQRGLPYAEQAQLARSAHLHRVRRGAYSVLASDLDPRVAHLQLLEATVRQSSPEAVVSHMSAAVVHGLPIWDDELTRVHLSRDRTSGGKTRRYVRLHPAQFAPGDVVEAAGFRVTSLARTVLDLSCALTPRRSVPIGDAALAHGLAPAELEAALALARGRTGVGAARRAIAILDKRSESVGESSSRVVLHEQGLAPSDLQYEVLDSAGRLVGRSDFVWEEARTLGEFDGRIKYGRLLNPRQSLEEVLFDEKRREDALRNLGWEVVRWVWAELARPAGLVQRLNEAFARGRRFR
jgi:predicted transcriptional regulator of viral defense system